MSPTTVLNPLGVDLCEPANLPAQALLQWRRVAGWLKVMKCSEAILTSIATGIE